MHTETEVAAVLNGGPDARPADHAKPLPGRCLVDGRTAAAKLGASYRHWLRLCDAGRAPYGLKLGALRRWDLSELDKWIEGGCRPVRRAGGAR